VAEETTLERPPAQQAVAAIQTGARADAAAIPTEQSANVREC
jgi:hypothetical protein